MFSTPEIYLQAELQYHREQIRRSLLGSRLPRQGKPDRGRSSSRLARHATTPAPASR